MPGSALTLLKTGFILDGWVSEVGDEAHSFGAPRLLDAVATL